ncbi:nicotinate-nucleotide--dimethylbenzimidazole phosphoribosyltransferase, partial [Thermus scotoductus]|uniref:nicotinate-nucleotide--dimethylbenzimidazole phosphoribosyltransferase n=1 Tax=Thermus scotoductus TaxID=37636 RepID=UPI0020A2EC8F
MDPEVFAQARLRMDQLTKPPRALGYLEEVALRLAALQGRVKPELGRGAVVVAAADHGVVAEGVSAYPQEVTRQMVLNFLRGGAAINQFALAADCAVYVLDVGVVGELPDHPGLLKRKVRPGTANLAQGPAMTPEEAERALLAGLLRSVRLTRVSGQRLTPGCPGTAELSVHVLFAFSVRPFNHDDNGHNHHQTPSP